MHALIRTARISGLLYLAVALTGGIGFLLIRPQLFVPDDATATLMQLVENEGLARIGLALELCLVLFQALVSLWFYKLFRSIDTFAAGAVAAFGLMNAVAILGSSAFLATALQVSQNGALSLEGGTATIVQSLYAVSGNMWAAGNVFFGLWLLPMGWLVLRSGWMPRALGWVLVTGGIGYVLAAFVNQLLPSAAIVGTVLGSVAGVGEVWMIGYLLIYGVRPGVLGQADGASARAATVGS